MLQSNLAPTTMPKESTCSVFSKVAGKFWIDRQDLGWIKVAFDLRTLHNDRDYRMSLCTALRR